MDLSYGDELEGFREEIGEFLNESWPLQGDEAELPKHKQAALFRGRAIAHGYLCRNIPQKYGGCEQEPDVLKAQIIREEFGRAFAPGEARGIGTMMNQLQMSYLRGKRGRGVKGLREWNGIRSGD